MGVLRVDKEVFNNYEDRRMEDLCKDIREIIDQRMELAELTGFPYSHTTGRDRIKKAIRITMHRYAQENDLWTISSIGVFDISIRKDKEGHYHYYVMFDPNKWDNELEDGMRRKQQYDAKRVSAPGKPDM